MNLSLNKLKLTDGERKILKELRCEHYTEIAVSIDVIYKLVLENIFINDISGPAVDAFRRIFIAYRNCDPYRDTQEFEELAKFNKEEIAIDNKLWLHLDEVTIYPHGSDEDDNPIEDDSFIFWIAYITNDNNESSDVLDNFIEDKYRTEYPNFTFGTYNECIVEVKHGAITNQTYPASFTA